MINKYTYSKWLNYNNYIQINEKYLTKYNYTSHSNKQVIYTTGQCHD